MKVVSNYLTFKFISMNKLEIVQKVKALEGLTQDERAYLVNLVNTKKKYGLVWEDKPEEVEEYLRENLPVLKELKNKAIINGEEHPNHILIEGDNLHTLTALTFTHEGKIDVIYIDPPYNTGSKEDFIYNDHYVDKEDAFRHSKWLSFMQRRLKLAKVLLKEDGVIFCSIGDDEISQLTLLFNEIFTEANKLGVISRLAKPADDQGNYFSSSKDYVVAYTKNIRLLANFKDSVNEDLFKKIETDGPKKGEKYRDDVAFYQASLGVRPNLRYYVLCPDGSLVIPPGNTFPSEKKDGAQSVPETDEDKCWRWSQEKYFNDKHLLVFKKSNKTPLVDENGNQAKWNVYTKSYLNDRSEKGASPRDHLDQFINRKGADLIKHYDIKFSYSKPFELIQHLIKITNKGNNITVLDFFAGSGTTLQSVLNINETDNGFRKCILTTNNENNICEDVTYPRCNRILKRYVNKKGKEMPFFSKNNLRYYKSEFISREPSLKNKRHLTQLATELLCIKEDCYAEQKINIKQARLFANSKVSLLILFDDHVIPQALEFIKTLEAPEIKVYVFSMGSDPYTEDFAEVLDKVTLCALPDAIYKAYQNVLPKRNRFIPIMEEEPETLTNENVEQLSIL
jgi:adenine-specific DNA-methyltransferase